MRIAFTFLFVIFGISSVFSTEKSAAFLCRKYIVTHEKKTGIPPGLLGAISVIESGKVAKGHKHLVAWPWVINVEGKPEYYTTKTRALKALRHHLNRGVVNIDVGCMQLNFRYHGAAFRSPAYMMDPARNVAYAAKFLKGLRQQHGSWTKAIGHYHSATLKHQVPYRHKVYRKWRKDRKDQTQSQKSSQEKTLLTAAMKAQVRRLLDPLNSLSDKAPKKKKGYDIIRPKSPLVPFKKIEVTSVKRDAFEAPDLSSLKRRPAFFQE